MGESVFGSAYQFAVLLGQTFPLRRLGMRHAQVIKNTKHEMVDECLDGLRSMIKTRTGGNNVRARARQTQHVFQVNRVVRGFSRNDDEPAILFQGNVGGSMDQIGSRA